MVNICSKLRIYEKCETLNGRLPPEDGSIQPQTLRKRVSDEPRLVLFWRQKHQHFAIVRKFWTGVHPPRMAPLGLKLCQNAFQTIPDISFFDADNKKKSKFQIERSVFCNLG